MTLRLAPSVILFFFSAALYAQSPALGLGPSFIADPKAPPPSAEEQTALAREAFKKGVESFQAKQFDMAEKFLTQVPELGGYLSLYKHWYLGQTYLELGKSAESEPEFSKVLASQASSELKYQAQFFLGDAALRQKKYAEVVRRLVPLERKWRRSYRQPEVQWRLMVAELKLNRTDSMCKRARRLYAKHPAHALVIGWGHDLRAVEIDGKKLPCTPGKDDFGDRVRNLQWAGESEKAHSELMALHSKAEGEALQKLDLMLASYMVNEGSVEDALNLLVRYYPQLKSNLPYLTLLGKAAARSGEYETAVGAYERAYSLDKFGRKGREALFQAAYLSYQFQDYDGAVRKFQQFIKANPRSGLAKDAQWHLAWLQYLRNDYKGAIEKFKQVAKNSRSRRGGGDSLQEKLLYWSAMAYLRLNQISDARTALESILGKNPYSYYGLAAQARLESIKVIEPEKPRVPAALAALPMDAPAFQPPAAAPVVAEEDESEETISDTSSETVSTTDEAGGEDEGIQASSFKDPAHRARIDVAQKLIQLGLYDLAKWELWEVEKRTRNPQYMRMLISAYEGIGYYHRSATIAELGFGKEREEQSFDSMRPIWTSMFPQAYKNFVAKSSRDYSVPEEWIWAIMRTESMYKNDVISPVGAKGLMQVMPGTAKNLFKLAGENVKMENIELTDPATSIRLGGQYLARLMQKFKGQLPLVAAAYNAGPHRVESWLVSFGSLETDEFVEHIPFLETRNYVKRVVRNHTFYRRLYAKDQKPVEYLAKTLGVPIPSRAATREAWDTL